MLAALLDVDLLDEHEILDLDAADPRNWMRFCKLVQIAKRANYNGCVLRSDLRPYSASDLAAYTRQRDRLEEWVAFLALATELGLIRVESRTGAFQIVHWSRWHKPPSHQTDAARARQQAQREKERDCDIANNTESHNCHKMSQGVQDVASVTTLTRSRSTTHRDQKSQPALISSAENGEKTEENGRSDGSSLNGYAVSSQNSARIAGVTTVSALANRYLDTIRSVYRSWMPGIYDADQLAKAASDLTSRKSRWDQHFSQDDFCEGLRLAAETAKAAAADGEVIKLLVPWVLKVASTQYFESAHEWRMLNAQAEARGRPPLPPLQADTAKRLRRA